MAQHVLLEPIAGFCLKTTTVQPASVKIGSSDTITPKKLFLNICWSDQIPPPPKGRGSEQAGEQSANDDYYVPVVISEAKEDKDKAGQPCLVFDCIYNTSLRSRCRDSTFKTFIQELALQRIEAQTGLVLSRHISTPNIASKGKLSPRNVLIPAAFLSPSTPLIEEITDVPKKGILKATTKPAARPTWRWLKTPTGSIEITIPIPALTHSLVTRTTLDVEPRRVLVAVPDHPLLDINLAVSDAEIAATSGNSEAADAALKLKRERALDVERATAEWRVGEGVLVLVM
ncbi:pre-RNA processing PIH1/Nop17-domain-containing protein [Roridomyces roridus]|uniref:Pre-RNA processing PIH1/Nop17-domain-containing protein n=1 Tax=Roridomyces roridus TaxID=1738132 RepID=A0AAD7FGV1_9AGAR|nr:pre-RNA processing PIH1/Nop17-domain-containing protein [Roridomyces roridus]